MELNGSSFLYVNHSSCKNCGARIPDKKAFRGRHEFTHGQKFCDAVCHDKRIRMLIDEVV